MFKFIQFQNYHLNYCVLLELKNYIISVYHFNFNIKVAIDIKGFDNEIGIERNR